VARVSVVVSVSVMVCSWLWDRRGGGARLAAGDIREVQAVSSVTASEP
jgi:hypothetical protein